MNRRSFLKGVGAVVAVPVVAKAGLPDWQKVGSQAEIPTVRHAPLPDVNGWGYLNSREIIAYDIGTDSMVLRIDVGTRDDRYSYSAQLRLSSDVKEMASHREKAYAMFDDWKRMNMIRDHELIKLPYPKDYVRPEYAA